MSLLLKLGRGLQGFMGGSLVLGTKKLQQTLTSSGTYTANGLSTAYVVIGGGANGGNGPGNGNSNPGGPGGFITVGTGTFNTPFPYTIGGVSGTTNFGPGVSASGAPNPAAAGGPWTPSGDPGTGSATNASVTIAPSSNVPESAFTITVGGGGAGGRQNNFTFEPENNPLGAGKAGGGNVPSPVAPVTGQSSGTQGGSGGRGYVNLSNFNTAPQPGEPGKRGSGGGSAGAGNEPRSGGSGGAGVIYVYYGDFV